MKSSFVTYCRIFSLLVWLFFPMAVFGQAKSKELKRDTTLLEHFEGAWISKGYDTDTLFIPHGDVSFSSKLIGSVQDQGIRKLDIKGEYFHGRRHGRWSIDQSEYVVNVQGLNRVRKQVGLRYELSGVEEQVEQKFQAGVAQGSWQYSRHKIVDGNVSHSAKIGTLQFDRNILVGLESSSEDYLSTRIKLTDDGYLDGEVVLEYTAKAHDQRIREVRTYDNGFLLRIEKYFDTAELPYLVVLYDDIAAMLDAVESQKKLNVSEQGFGLWFDNGYSSTSEKYSAQGPGNSAIRSFIDQFMIILPDSSDEFRMPDFRFTRRFVFEYPEEDQIWFEKVKQINDSLCDQIEFLRASPGLRLYSEDSPNIRLALRYAEIAMERCITVRELVKRHENDEFKYRSRDEYFRRGISGLNVLDSLTATTSEGDSLVARFPFRNLVTGPDDLFQKVYAYLDELASLFKSVESLALQRIQRYSQQDVIDSLDSEIYYSEQRVDSLLEGLRKGLSDSDFEQMTFQERVFMVLTRNQIAQHRKTYLGSEVFDEKLQAGKGVMCFNEFLINNSKRVQKASHERKFVDSLFTIYEEHPFDTRLFESRILGNIREKGGKLLFREYERELLSANTCEEALEALDKIEALQKLLRKIVRNHESAEVIQLNRVLRRESVPARIERLLGLSPKA